MQRAELEQVDSRAAAKPKAKLSKTLNLKLDHGQQTRNDHSNVSGSHLQYKSNEQLHLPALKQGLKVPFNQTSREALAQSEEQYSEVLVQDFVPSHISNTNEKRAGYSGDKSTAQKSRRAPEQREVVSHFDRGNS